MGAERVPITSLRRPPEGYVFDPEERARQLKAQTRVAYYKHSPDGAFDGAHSAADLPTLTVGVDVLPRSCPHCNSRYLLSEPPLGPHARGLLTCGRCSRQVCWLGETAGPAPIPDAFDSVIPAPEAPRAGPPSPTLGAMRVRCFERRPGCGPACDDRDGHDPETHESYGRDGLIAQQQARLTGTARFGPLFIDFDHGDVEVEGAPVHVTAVEWRILRYLAARADRLCGYFELTEAAWDHQAAVLGAMPYARCGRFNTVRSHLSRLRGKLGPAAALIATTKGIGLTLRSSIEEAS